MDGRDKPGHDGWFLAVASPLAAEIIEPTKASRGRVELNRRSARDPPLSLTPLIGFAPVRMLYTLDVWRVARIKFACALNRFPLRG